MKFANTIFQIAKLRFSSIFDKFPEFSNNSQGTSLKARGLKFWLGVVWIASARHCAWQVGRVDGLGAGLGGGLAVLD